MKLVKLLLALAVFACAPLARAWDCPSGMIRQQAPAGTPTNALYYDVVEGIAFICVPANPPSSGTGSSNTNTNTNSNSNSNTNNVKVQNNNNVYAQGGAGGSAYQTQKQSQSQTQTATGGNANSSSNATANGNGVGNGNNSNDTVEVKQTATAVAPTIFPTTPCFKGYSGGAQSSAFGVSFGGGKIDENCARLEVARSFAGVGNRLAYCKAMLTNKYVKQAGITLDDCVGPPPAQVVVAAPVAVPVQPAPVITVNVPAPVVTIVQAPAQPAPVDVAAAARRVHQRHPIKPCPAVITNDTLPSANN